MKRLLPALLLCATGSAFAWGTAGLAYYQQYQTGVPVAAPQPVANPTDSYNQGYMDGFNEAQGQMGRHGYGDRYDEGYDAARKAAEATWRLNHPY